MSEGTFSHVAAHIIPTGTQSCNNVDSKSTLYQRYVPAGIFFEQRLREEI